jgi:hypothetical protein
MADPHNFGDGQQYEGKIRGQESHLIFPLSERLFVVFGSLLFYLVHEVADKIVALISP